MERTSNSLGGDQATSPRIVLPITSRGLEVTDRLCWAVLAMAMAVAVALILYVNRGTTFFLDELAWVYDSPGLSSPGDVLEPHNGHLIAVSRLLYKAILETVGAEYVAFRVLGVLSVVLAAGLFYVLAKRRMGPLPALAPVLVLLFFGSAWQHLLVPVGFTVIFSVAAGLAALVALDRGDRRGDVLACALLVLAIATYTSGLAFAVGVAVAVLLREDRWRRAWIFGLPIALYAAWWLWSLGAAESAEQHAKLVNALLIPSFVADSLAAVIGAVTGLALDFDRRPFIGLGWGRVLAAVAAAALVMRFRRIAPPPLLWVAVGILLTYWSLGGLVADTADRAPWAVRYMYPSAVGLLLVAAAAAAGARFTRVGLIALAAVTAISLATNLAFVRDGGRLFRDQYSAPTRAQFAIIELARDHVDSGFDPEILLPDEAQVGSPAGAYLTVADAYGSLGYTLSELEGRPEGIRAYADRILAGALGLRLDTERGERGTGECLRLRATAPGAPIEFELPAGGAILSGRGGASTVTLGRFADAATAEVGTLSPNEPAALEVPKDSSDRAWRASATGARSINVCGPD